MPDGARPYDDVSRRCSPRRRSSLGSRVGGGVLDGRRRRGRGPPTPRRGGAVRIIGPPPPEGGGSVSAVGSGCTTRGATDQAAGRHGRDRPRRVHAVTAPATIDAGVTRLVVKNFASEPHDLLVIAAAVARRGHRCRRRDRREPARQPPHQAAGGVPRQHDLRGHVRSAGRRPTCCFDPEHLGRGMVATVTVAWPWRADRSDVTGPPDRHPAYAAQRHRGVTAGSGRSGDDQTSTAPSPPYRHRDPVSGPVPGARRTPARRPARPVGQLDLEAALLPEVGDAGDDRVAAGCDLELLRPAPARRPGRRTGDASGASAGRLRPPGRTVTRRAVPTQSRPPGRRRLAGEQVRLADEARHPSRRGCRYSRVGVSTCSRRRRRA